MSRSDRPRLLLVNPPVGLFNEHNAVAADARAVPTVGAFSYRDEMTPPDAAMLHLAALSREHGYAPEYIDLNLQDGAALDPAGPAPARAAILLTTHQANAGYRLAGALAARGAKIAFLGPHATALPAEALRHGDAALVGEAERPFARWLAGESGALGPDFADSLDDLPDPDFSVVDARNARVVPLLSARGCPRACAYCWQILTAGRAVRKKSAARLAADLSRALSATPLRHFLFMDDNFFAEPAHTRSTLETIRPFAVRFSCQAEPDAADHPDLLDLAASAGCMRMLVGFESVAPGPLAEASRRKVALLPRYGEAIAAIQARGIGVVGSFVIGFDGETRESVAMLRDFLDRHIMANVSISILAPVPGTPLFDRLNADGRLLTDDWDRYNQCSVVFEPRGMTAAELTEAARDLFAFAHSAAMRRRRVRHFLDIRKRC